MQGLSKQPAVKVGQRWRENDPRVDRIVTVMEVHPGGMPPYAIIRTCPGASPTKARLDRFNGKRSGYSIVEDVCKA